VKRAVFWVHDPEAPSFRHRLAAHFPALEQAGIRCEVDVFPRRSYGRRILARARGLAGVDLLVIAKLKLETGERAVVRNRANRIVYDVDDAVYYAKPDRPGQPPGYSRRRVSKFLKTCAISDLVTAGNPTIAAFARRSARHVEIVPTGIDSAAYMAPIPRADGRFDVAWIGLPGNLPYLRLIERPLARLQADFPGSLHVISEALPAAFSARTIFVPWSAATEARALAECDAGVMPLEDDEWTRGKGGFKLLQYMAATLPTVASPVGVNAEIVVPGQTGFLARDEDGWEQALRALAGDRQLRRRMGVAGRQRAERLFDRRVVGERLVSLYHALISPPELAID
jgi:glycosyltransferase involved in cell wall biosynthesis